MADEVQDTSGSEEEISNAASQAPPAHPRPPYVGQTLSSWTEAEHFLDNHAEASHFQWAKYKSTSLDAIKHALKEKGQPLFKESLKYRNIQLTCVCGGDIRINRGTGERPIQE